MKILSLFLFMVLSAFSMNAQTIIKGRITDSVTSSPVEDANITLSEEGSTIISDFTVSGKDGEYSLTYKGNKEKITVTVSGFNLRKQSRTIENQSQTLNFLVEEEEIRLNEVIVRAPKIRQSGDTLNYNVAHFTGQEDRSIADVLKKMPGIQVHNDGTVLYQGRAINKFYIENLDLLQGRYGIATNNISARDVATVQVMENHQPIRALVGKEFVNEAALNLKLKESGKGAFFLKAQAGVGVSPLLLSNELLGMYFTGNMQHLSIYKGDNSGRDITGELQSLYTFREDKMGIDDLLSIIELSPPSISRQRSLFNDAHTGTVNHLNKLNKEYILTTNLNYLHDEIRREDYSYLEYFLPGAETVEIREEINNLACRNLFNANFNLTANTDTYYLKNDLKLSGEWDRHRGDIFSDELPVSQRLKSPDYSISNLFDLVNTKGGRTYRFNSFTGYKSIGQTLTVTPPVFDQLFPSETDLISTGQHLDLSAFETRNKLSWSRDGRFSIRYTAEINALTHKLNSQLEAYYSPGILSGDSLKNNIRYDYWEGVFSASTHYDITSTMNIMLTLPLRYLFLYRENNGNSSESFLYLDPSMIINWQISPSWSSNFLYGFNRHIGGIQNQYTNPVMVNYRSLMQNDGKLEKSRRHNLTWMLGYKNPFSSLFGSMHVFYTNNRSNLLYNYDYNGIFTTKSSVEKQNTNHNLYAGASIGKEVDAITSNISWNISYNGNHSEQFILQQATGIQVHTVTLSPRIVIRISPFATLQYSSIYSWMKSRIDVATIHIPSIKTWSQQFNLNIFPTGRMVISFRCDYFRNSSVQDGNRVMWFGDIGLKYKLKKIEFLLDWNNVFNVSHYFASSFNEMGRYYYSYKLRPMELLLKLRFNIL
ncbi:CarboxypepD_reg-like domain-containing protein [Porphyromonadaceae bacterium KH3R12]|uniref:carboxypeptidase-like regulatory domain-containing protein n=1 Tax=Proteiniphilum saccharofermentans TaxID=1642647 RepID=UPI00089BA9CE|nr:carboxypeptidase-like regulatory domain-containing protein [Proteiniphilum saccharofermentans]SEA01391.1 CarboxypepD_reg-like domain-containing protein [Porphyromonadaceae bacterium KH3R12]